VAGWANQADKQAEIRSWEHLVAVHRQRAGGKGGLPDEASYRKLVLDFKRFFEAEQFGSRWWRRRARRTRTRARS
jgi:hypothetical protein